VDMRLGADAKATELNALIRCHGSNID